VNAGSLLAIVTGILGLAGIIFTALKYNRDDTTALVGQQSQILTDMKALNDELRETADALRAERDELRGEVARLSGQVDALRGELRTAHARIEGTMARVEEKLDA
jgi:predicted nuclease with TOPRIM domain